MVTTEMTTTSQPATTAGDKFLQAAASAAARIASLWRAVRNRRSVVKLLDWDERMLRDIGLTPGDVRAVLAAPISDDPSYRLGAISIERREALRARMQESHVWLRQRPARAGSEGRRSYEATRPLG
jgi:uncharacterized protein YjiS (DUF1127 family)